GAIPAVEVGLAESQGLAKVTITENLVNGIDDDDFRIIAPTGVTFATGGTFSANATGVVSTTFSANDTLLVSVAGTNNAATDTVTVTPKAFIGPSVAVDQLLTFTIVDGDTA